MPYGVVHLKAKKQWKKGRTIISYFKSYYGPLLRVPSNVLNTMIHRLLPQSPGQLSIPQLWHHFHDHLHHTPDHVDLYAVNDDLVGFFNSVPQDRLVDAVQSLANRWQHTFDTPTITVDAHTTGDPIQLAHIGRHHRTLDTSDITTIVALALDSCIFKACTLLPAGSRSRDWLPAFSCAVQCRYHPHPAGLCIHKKDRKTINHILTTCFWVQEDGYFQLDI